MIRVKVTAEKDGKRFAIGIPAIIDSDGELTITHLQAIGAGELLRSAAFPETIRARDWKVPARRRNRARKSLVGGVAPV